MTDELHSSILAVTQHTTLKQFKSHKIQTLRISSLIVTLIKVHLLYFVNICIKFCIQFFCSWDSPWLTSRTSSSPSAHTFRQKKIMVLQFEIWSHICICQITEEKSRIMLRTTEYQCILFVYETVDSFIQNKWNIWDQIPTEFEDIILFVICCRNLTVCQLRQKKYDHNVHL